MATFQKFNQFPEDLCKGVHNFTSDATCTLVFALSAVAPDAANTVIADITQIAYTNCSSRTVTGVTAEQTGGVCPITANDLTLTASGGAIADFRYIILYNSDTASGSLIGFWDTGSTQTLLDGQSLLLDFTTGIATVTVS